VASADSDDAGLTYISISQDTRIDGGLGVGSTSTNPEAKTIEIADHAGTPSAPSGGALLYASSGELVGMDDAGNTTTLTPHNFSLIPNGPSEPLAWSYYSERDGRAVNVDMMKLARLVEELTGEQLVYIADHGRVGRPR
jgi:hypothetical protein